ncbi:hypothetical protein D068_cds18510 [Bacillus atrophaeus UCMB-5137]|nr:hypothetical protein D068_cds18510 [Bacillus atrophaeus UCMB-5137]
MSIGIAKQTLCEQVSKHHRRLLTIANASGALTASVKGAIHAAPGKQHVVNFISARTEIHEK